MTPENQACLLNYVIIHKMTGLADPRLAAAIEESLIELAVYSVVNGIEKKNEVAHTQESADAR